MHVHLATCIFRTFMQLVTFVCLVKKSTMAGKQGGPNQECDSCTTVPACRPERHSVSPSIRSLAGPLPPVVYNHTAQPSPLASHRIASHRITSVLCVIRRVESDGLWAIGCGLHTTLRDCGMGALVSFTVADSWTSPRASCH